MSTSAQTTRTPRRRVREMEVEVVHVRRDTPDTTTLFMSVGDEPVAYESGHFCTIESASVRRTGALHRLFRRSKGAAGKATRPIPWPLRRTKSTSPSPSKRNATRAARPRTPPLLSPLLTYYIQEGRRLVISGFTGRVYLSRRCLRPHRSHCPRVRWQRHRAQPEPDQGKPTPRRPA